jgi:hypothetical protein
VADRAMLLQRGQYIFEAVPGTPLAATKKFTSIELRPAMGADIYDIFGQGDQYARGTGLNTEWTDLAMTGMPTFDEMTPIGALFFGAPTITTPAGATNARQHAWTGVNGTIPTLKAITYEYGDSNRAHRISYVHGRDFTLNFARSGDGVSVDGTLMGQAMSDAFSLTGGTAALPFYPIEGVKADVYLDSTFAGIGTTKLTRAFSASFSLGNLWESGTPLNSTQTSFSYVVPTRVDAGFTLRLGADEIGMPIGISYRLGTVYYVRVEVKNGVEIDAAIATSEYRLTLDLPVKCVEPGSFDEETGLLVIEPTFRLVNDATAAFAWRLQVVNAQTAL